MILSDEVENPEVLLQQFAEHTPDVFWMFSADWEDLLFLNGSYEEVWGRSPSALEDDPTDFLAGVHPEARDRIRADMERLSNGDPVEHEYRVNAEEDFGRWVLAQARPIYEDGEVARLAGFVRDITDRKEREQELERYETFVETVAGGVFAQDENARYSYVNSYIEEQTGYDREEIIGRGPSMFMPEEDIREVSAAIGEMLEGSRETVTFETEITTASGEAVPAEGQLALLPTDDGFRGTVGMIRDITDRKERERELERQKERLDEFASVVSHDLRNPLNVAEGHLELLADECDSEHVETIERAHTRMKRIIEDTLTLARQGNTVGEPEPVRLADVVERCWRNVETGAADLTVDEGAVIVADPDRLQRLLENLFRNAVEHGGPGVRVRVGALPDGFYVADTGPGIPEEERDEVFETGYSTGDTGTGFGLSIVKRIAEAHGWEVRATAGEAGGARFEFTGVEQAG